MARKPYTGFKNVWKAPAPPTRVVISIFAGSQRGRPPRPAPAPAGVSIEPANEEFLEAFGRLERLREQKGELLGRGRKPGRKLTTGLRLAARHLKEKLAEIERQVENLFGPIVHVDLGRETELRVKALMRGRNKARKRVRR